MEDMSRICCFFSILAISLLTAFSASAHRVTLFATAQGDVISGSVYFSGGDPAKGAAVKVLDPQGLQLQTLVTGDDGNFTYKAVNRCDQRLVCELEDGHRCEFLIAAADLPENLPACGAAAAPAPSDQTAKPAPVAASGAEHTEDTEALVERIVAKHTNDIRRDLARYADRVYLDTVLGGIGFIVGICGLLFFLKGRKRSEGHPRD